MTTYHVQITEVTVPGADRPWLIDRRVAAVETAPCLAPVLVRALGRRRRIPCGRRLPIPRQCRNCTPRLIITEVRRITA